MENSAFDAILPLKVQSILSLLIELKKMSFEEALQYVYSSELYQLLEKEETKVWYYSPRMLYELIEEEKATGHLTLPDHV
jgi:hypothetical protein